jgi:uncharacterized protein YjbJ (UPF0337 family)
MDKDRLKGKAKDIAGRIERQAGEWTGNEDTQSEGAAKQAEGKVQNTWGKLKDAARDIKDDASKKDDIRKKEDVRNEDIERDDKDEVA